MHRTQNIGLGRLAHGILLIVGQDDHVLPRIAEIAIEVCRHVLDVIDAPAELPSLTKVVDADEKGFAPPRAVGILKAVALRGAVAEGLHGLGRWRRGIGVSLDVGVGIDGRQA